MSSLPFKICEKKDGFCIALWHDSQVNYCPSQVKENKNWLSGSIGRLKKVLHKSVTINNLLSIGMEVRIIWRGGRTGCWRMSMLLMALRSWTNINPHSCFCLFVCLFFYGEDGCVAGASARDYKTWGLPFFYISLISTRAAWLNGCYLMLERGLFGFIWIFIRSAEWIHRISVVDFAQRFSGTCSKRIKFSLFSLVDFRFKTVKDIERFSVLPGEMSRVELENY